MTQHFSSSSQLGEDQVDILNKAVMGQKEVKSLPRGYSNMDLDVPLRSDDVFHVPSLHTNSHPFPASRPVSSIIRDSYQWLNEVKNLLYKPSLSDGN